MCQFTSSPTNFLLLKRLILNSKSPMKRAFVTTIFTQKLFGAINVHGKRILMELPRPQLLISLLHTDSTLHSNQVGKKPVTLPSLMNFPLIMWPNLIKTIQNWFFYHFVIRSYLDQEFNMAEFDRGAKQAVSLVSKKLARGDWEDLKGLVEPNTLEEVKRKLSTFSVLQRELLNIEMEDIFFSFPYQVGIIIPDAAEPLHRRSQVSDEDLEEREPQKRFVEITFVFHILRGFANKSAAGEMKSLRDFIESEDRHNVMVCNYRFFKEFTQGAKDPTWVINMINQFLPADHQPPKN